ncbi:MAG: hypothetical protein K2O69_04365 [Odoribacter sp.]|nr:hypothetical protein [Odoribacter sp.]
MNLELFIARRLLRGNESRNVSVPIVKIALTGIALGVCVMLLSVFVITGFRQEITAKLSGFSAHLDVSSYEGEDACIVPGDTLPAAVRQLPGVRQVYPYVTKPAILESGREYTDAELRKRLSGHLCRCTGYENILRAVRKTMLKRLGKEPPEN